MPLGNLTTADLPSLEDLSTAGNSENSLALASTEGHLGFPDQSLWFPCTKRAD